MKRGFGAPSSVSPCGILRIRCRHARHTCTRMTRSRSRSAYCISLSKEEVEAREFPASRYWFCSPTLSQLLVPVLTSSLRGSATRKKFAKNGEGRDWVLGGCQVGEGQAQVLVHEGETIYLRIQRWCCLQKYIQSRSRRGTHKVGPEICRLKSKRTWSFSRKRADTQSLSV